MSSIGKPGVPGAREVTEMTGKAKGPGKSGRRDEAKSVAEIMSGLAVEGAEGFNARRDAARSVSRLDRSAWMALGAAGDQISALVTRCWDAAVAELERNSRDARVASELKCLAPALAVSGPRGLRERCDAVLAIGALPDSTRAALAKEFDRALVIAAREEKVPRSARNDDYPRHSERSEESPLPRSAGWSRSDEVALCGAVPCALYCRAGLEDLILADFRARKFNARTAGKGLVIVNMGTDADGARPSPFAIVNSIRMWHDCGFVFTFPPSATLDEIAALIAGPVSKLLAPFGVRGRFDWQASRGANWDLAGKLVRLGSGIVNAPREADWDLMIDQMAGRLVARPKAWFDHRFDYRERDVPASSHAPLAAALARLAFTSATWSSGPYSPGNMVRPDGPFPGEYGGTRAGESAQAVVWDPFCGAGTELIEAGLLNPRARLIGSDMDPRAIEAASHNARRAGVKVEWLTGDFRKVAGQIGPVDVILTNPPLGRRVAAGEALDLADELIAIAARKLTPGKGRMVWVAPDAGRAAVTAHRAGLKVAATRRVDLGGFDGEIQVLVV